MVDGLNRLDQLFKAVLPAVGMIFPCQGVSFVAFFLLGFRSLMRLFLATSKW